MRRGRRGFLLLEATVTAAVIAVGLVFISRGMGTSLKTLTSLQQYDRFLRLAESQLNELSAEAQGGLVIQTKQGTFDEPDQDVAWELMVEPVQSKDILQAMGPTGPVLCEITLSVHPAQADRPAFHLETIWPKEWTGECR